MNIYFYKIFIQGFQSISEIDLELSNYGVCLVKGINNYEENTNSNGSGKSSIFEAILFAIYGKTSSGINSPLNRYYNDGCYVELEFNINNQKYKILRAIKSSKHGTILKIYKEITELEYEDISGRNKTDTEKIIKNDIFPISMDIFLSTIFLSQGFSNRMGILRPADRKNRIETLSDINDTVNNFKNNMTSIREEYKDKKNESNSDLKYNEGLLYGITNNIDNINNLIGKYNSSNTDIDINSINDSLDKFNELRNNILETIKSNDNEKSDLNINKVKLHNNIRTINSDIEKINKQLNDIKTNDRCPTCKQLLSNNISSELNNNFIKTRDNKQILRNKLSEQVKSLDIKIDSINNKLLKLNQKESLLRTKIDDLKKLQYESSNKINVDSELEKLEDFKRENLEVNKKIEDLNNNILDYDSKIEISSHCVSLISNQFRAHLLQNILNFMNLRLIDYSSMLFSNDSDIIKLEVNNSSVDIYVGDAEYETLSGGEKRKVDIALVFTQRDLAINIAGFSSNLLILDETMENLDKTSSQITLNMILDSDLSVESLFIISHNDYSLPSDNILTIIKDEDRMSKLIN